MIWLAICITAAGCYALKAVGFVIPPGLIERDAVRRVTTLMPVALLASLVVTQTFTEGHRIAVDPRAAGVAVAAIAVWRRAPLIVVIILAAGTAALLRAV